MMKENAALKADMDSLKNIRADKGKLQAELKDLKTLSDAKIITQAEFDSKKKIVLDKWQ